MDELRTLHLGAEPRPGRRSVMERLQEAFLAAAGNK
jgi:hypothetical protein